MEKSSDQPSFIRSLIKSKTENQQLDFWRSVSIAYICSKTSFPENDMIKFRNFHNKGDSWYLVFSVDGRSKLYNDIQKSNHVELCWFFALSREKYRIKSTLKGYSTDSFAAEPSADSALTFEQFKNLWENEINKEEKKLFTEAAPSTKTSDKLNKQIDDINNYNTPDIGGISTNFALLLAEVSEVEHTKFAMPQVVADSRHPKFESLFSPYKVTTKYLHRKKADNPNEWETVSLNP